MNRTKFMDVVICPLLKSDKNRKIKLLYLLNHENHFTLLIHHTQSKLKEFVKSNNNIVKPFLCAEFLLKEEWMV